jgi:hypothetical protein
VLRCTCTGLSMLKSYGLGETQAMNIIFILAFRERLLLSLYILSNQKVLLSVFSVFSVVKKKLIFCVLISFFSTNSE